MARVRVRVEDFDEGSFPPVCVVTGKPCDTTTPIELPVATTATIGGVAAVLVFGVLGLLWSINRNPLKGYLPVLQEGLDGIRRSRREGQWIVAASLVALLALVLLSPRLDGFDELARLAMFSCFGGLAFGGYRYFRPRGAPGGSLDPTLRWLELSPVSDAFAAAYTALEDQRRSARRRDPAFGE